MRGVDLLRGGSFCWFEHEGVGFLDPGAGINYGDDYFAEYVERAGNEVSDALMDARCDLVARHHDGIVVDVGVGAGAFVDRRSERGQATFGHDVNPAAIHWLIERGLWWDVWETPAPAATFWDVLEHFEDPSSVLARVDGLAFVSIPIFRDLAHALSSKHYKPGEHVWYFTERGLIEFFGACGFELIEACRVEEVLGREDIGSFAFRRVGRP